MDDAMPRGDDLSWFFSEECPDDWKLSGGFGEILLGIFCYVFSIRLKEDGEHFSISPTEDDELYWVDKALSLFGSAQDFEERTEYYISRTKLRHITQLKMGRLMKWWFEFKGLQIEWCGPFVMVKAIKETTNTMLNDYLPMSVFPDVSFRHFGIPPLFLIKKRDELHELEGNLTNATVIPPDCDLARAVEFYQHIILAVRDHIQTTDFNARATHVLHWGDVTAMVDGDYLGDMAKYIFAVPEIDYMTIEPIDERIHMAHDLVKGMLPFGAYDGTGKKAMVGLLTLAKKAACIEEKTLSALRSIRITDTASQQTNPNMHHAIGVNVKFGNFDSGLLQEIESASKALYNLVNQEIVNFDLRETTTFENKRIKLEQGLRQATREMVEVAHTFMSTATSGSTSDNKTVIDETNLSDVAGALYDKFTTRNSNTSFTYLPDALVMDIHNAPLLLVECKNSEGEASAIELILAMVQILAYCPIAYSLFVKNDYAILFRMIASRGKDYNQNQIDFASRKFTLKNRNPEEVNNSIDVVAKHLYPELVRVFVQLGLMMPAIVSSLDTLRGQGKIQEKTEEDNLVRLYDNLQHNKMKRVSPWLQEADENFVAAEEDRDDEGQPSNEAESENNDQADKDDEDGEDVTSGVGGGDAEFATEAVLPVRSASLPEMESSTRGRGKGRRGRPRGQTSVEHNVKGAGRGRGGLARGKNTSTENRGKEGLKRSADKKWGEGPLNKRSNVRNILEVDKLHKALAYSGIQAVGDPLEPDKTNELNPKDEDDDKPLKIAASQAYSRPVSQLSTKVNTDHDTSYEKKSEKVKGVGDLLYPELVGIFANIFLKPSIHYPQAKLVHNKQPTRALHFAKNINIKKLNPEGVVHKRRKDFPWPKKDIPFRIAVVKEQPIRTFTPDPESDED